MRNQTSSYKSTVRKNFVSTRNACKLCAPLGASIAYRGIEGCVPLVHGSQGCSTYIRRYIISHFREPVDIASSNFSETSAIFGGGDNLCDAFDNVIRQYRPSVIGVATTCLSETIGDDVGRYIADYRIRKGGDIPPIIYASTPSYSGTHMEGFRSALRAIVDTLASSAAPKGGINVISSLLSSEDIRHIREILDSFETGYTLLPDYSETLDGESWESYQKIPKGGTTLASIKSMGSSFATIELGSAVKPEKSAAHLLFDRFGVEAVSIGLPIGIDMCDTFFGALERITGRHMHGRFANERGRLVDAYIDAHKYLFGARAVVYGEADFVSAISSFLSEVGVRIVLCATGAKADDISGKLYEGLTEKNAILSDDVDFVTMTERARELSPDIVIGSSKGFNLANSLDVPLVRCGFPIHDRFGGQRILHVGYRGTISFLDRIVNAIIGKRQNSNQIGYSYM
jgi:nitrogenase molybdenum-iron protein NifN